MQSISPTELKQWLSTSDAPPLLLDVREPEEFAFCHLEGSLHIPMAEMATRWRELDPTRDLVVVCHHGVRSFQVAQFLETQGFDRVINLTGGLDAWSREVDPSLT
ncbi:MAG TPA: rhodanese-like domain-containing protein [Methylococcus sp.]|nr:rhodanese-like domain-containing protein [Methylococcus sp.]